MGTQLSKSSLENYSIRNVLVGSATYPLRTPNKKVAFLVGGLLLIPVSIVTSIPWDETANSTIINVLLLGSALLSILPIGYYVRVIQQVSRGNRDPPAFDLGNWKSLFSVGTRAIVIYMIFLFYPQKAMGAVTGLPGQISIEALEGWLGGIMTVLLVFIASTVVYPSTVLNFVREEKLLDAFSPTLLLSMMVNRKFIIGIIPVAIITQVISFTISRLVLSDLTGDFTIGPLTIVLVGLAAFYLGMSLNYALGRQLEAVLVTEAEQDTAFEPSFRPPLNALTELYEAGVFTADEYYLKRRDLDTVTETTSPAPSTQLTTVRQLNTRGIVSDEEFEATKQALSTDTEHSQTGSTVSADNGDSNIRSETRPLEALYHLYEEGILTKAEYEEIQRTLREQTNSKVPDDQYPSKIAAQLTDLEYVHELELVTDREYAEKRQQIEDQSSL
ncbi:DUF4013 domain-containing protein [Natronorubrum halophilum]|uniref:DUF4013 domain-containing protein n=1 Tax=Natronorubrum halophilum TaxID=1702106 RepID=UPI000EF71D18|nr:DUF4013 domain-containing protein [Natronorubrum halophilum]